MIEREREKVRATEREKEEGERGGEEGGESADFCHSLRKLTGDKNIKQALKLACK